MRHLDPEPETTLTDDRIALLELVEKAADTDLVSDMLVFAAERIMDTEVETLIGVAKGARCVLLRDPLQQLS